MPIETPIRLVDQRPDRSAVDILVESLELRDELAMEIDGQRHG
jgi:hypothetical protein